MAVMEHNRRGLDEMHLTARLMTPSDTRLDAVGASVWVAPLRPSAGSSAAGTERAEASA